MCGARKTEMKGLRMRADRERSGYREGGKSERDDEREQSRAEGETMKRETKRKLIEERCDCLMSLRVVLLRSDMIVIIVISCRN